MKIEPKKILTLAAHTDDVEIGCAATLHKFKDADVKVIAFSLKLGLIEAATATVKPEYCLNDRENLVANR